MSAICGIIAVKNKDNLSKQVRAMLKEMEFRGGKGSFEHCNDGFAVGWQSSESINEITKTPFYNEYGNVLAIVEGEIYNYGEIASDLDSKGYNIQTNSRWSVIPHLYSAYGKDFPAKINGIFVIALYDLEKQMLMLARDHMGSHSGFYYHLGNFFCFATTIKSILKTDFVKTEIAPMSVNQYFAGTCVSHPYTMFENVKSLRPGHILMYQQNQIMEYEYWPIGDFVEDYDRSEASFIDEIRETCLDSIKIRSDSAEDIGSVLSGGVDSSMIASTMAKRYNSSNPLNVFSVAYHEKKYDDSHLQKFMFDRYPLKGHIAYLTQDMVISILKEVVKHLDYPVNNSSALGTYLCMQIAGDQDMKYILDGEAADELFCGGGGVVGEHLIQLIEHLPYIIRKYTLGLIGSSLYMNQTGKKAALKRFCYRAIMPKYERMLTWLPAFDRQTRKKLLLNEFNDVVVQQDELAPGRSYLEKGRMKDDINLYLYGGCKTYLCNDLLYKNERMAAANHVVNRTPFIDKRLVELAFRIPAKYKLLGYTPTRCEKKWIYRKALKGLIPDEILWRVKLRGFSQPTAEWMKKDPLKSFLNNTLLSKRVAERGIMNIDFIRKILDEHFYGRQNRDRLLWGMLVFELWCQEYMDG